MTVDPDLLSRCEHFHAALNDSRIPLGDRVGLARQWVEVARDGTVDMFCKAAMTLAYRAIANHADVPEAEELLRECLAAIRRSRYRAVRRRWAASIEMALGYKRLLLDQDAAGAVAHFEGVVRWGMPADSMIFVNSTRACVLAGCHAQVSGRDPEPWYERAGRCVKQGVSRIDDPLDWERIKEIRLATDALELVLVLRRGRGIARSVDKTPFGRSVKAIWNRRAK